jgi:DNA-binding transcriptional MerR regulator/effector-binding domain-containing protein
MRSSLSIGEFSRATLLSVKTLRHYHEVGLLEPADVDPSSGRRRYAAEQIPTAQVIRRFRSLDMPVDEVRSLLTAPGPAGRNEVIAAHLDRLDANLQRTSAAVASLRDLLKPSTPAPGLAIEHRLVEATSAAAVHGTVEMNDLALWFEGAFGEIYATLAAQGTTPEGPGGGVYANELFTHEHGEATVFVPCRARFRASGRVEAVIIPAVELAVATHAGHHSEADRTYGALATHVAEHALAVDGPIREYYLVSSRDTADANQWRTEIGWPIFHLGAGTSPKATRGAFSNGPEG